MQIERHRLFRSRQNELACVETWRCPLGFFEIAKPSLAVGSDGDGLDEGVVLDVFGKFLQLGFIKGAATRVFLTALVNVDPYEFIDEIATYFGGGDEHSRRAIVHHHRRTTRR